MAELQAKGADCRGWGLLKAIPRGEATAVVALPDGGLRIEYGSKRHEYAAGDAAQAEQFAGELASVLGFGEARTEQMALFDASRGPAVYFGVWLLVTIAMLWEAWAPDDDSKSLIPTLTRAMGPIGTTVVTLGILLAIAGYWINRARNRPAVTAYRARA